MHLMKRFFLVSLLVFIGITCTAIHCLAQHFISIQADDKQPFTIQVNGTKFNSSKTGTIRIANLGAGNYNLVIAPAGKVAPQVFTCAVDKADLSYALINMGKKGWALKNLNSTEVLTASVLAVKQPAIATAASPPPGNSAFAVMLSEVINDPDLLKATPWVLSTKVEGDAANNQAIAMNEAQANDTNTYVAETRGVIKASERAVKEGTEMVFVDFNAYSGDTVKILVNNADGSVDNDLPSSQSAAPPLINFGNTSKRDTTPSTPSLSENKPAPASDTATLQQPAVAQDTKIPVKADSSATVKKAEEAPLPFDTSSNKQYTNPFFKKDKDKTPPTTAKTTAADTANPVADHEVKSPAIESNTTASVASPGVEATPKATTKEDCKKMLSDNDEEKLKHKIYLETDQDKIMEIAKKALFGKCINTAQVKDLSSFFLSDDARYNFFVTVYPFVYDFGNFSTLRTYMIDPKYKNMFDALIK